MAEFNCCLGVSAVFCCSYLLSSSLCDVAHAGSGLGGELQNTLNLAAGLINESLPRIGGSGVRLDRVISPGNKTLIYEYSFIDILGSQIDRSAAQQKIYRGSVGSLCDDPGQKDWLNKGVTTIYIYRDKKGSEVARVSISQIDCDKRFRW